MTDELPKIGTERIYRDSLDVLYPGERAFVDLTYYPDSDHWERVFMVMPAPGLHARWLRFSWRAAMSPATQRALAIGCYVAICINLAFALRPGAAWYLRTISIVFGVAAPALALVMPRVRSRRRRRAIERELGVRL